MWICYRAPVVKPAFTNSLGMDFALVPKGKAWLGGGGGKIGEDEVEFRNDFYLGVHEVTQSQWQLIMGKNPSAFSRLGGEAEAVKDIAEKELKHFPVEGVSWNDCHEFMRRLNEKTKESGWAYRLPTEAEWEYACRGGQLSKKEDYGFHYYFEAPTNDLPADRANIAASKLKRTRKVGSYVPNALGLHDMHGNVWEWCTHLVDGEERPIFRGGSWSNDGGNQATDRSEQQRTFAASDVGLRVARVRVPLPVSAPDLSKIKPFFEDRFDNPDSGFAHNSKEDFGEASYADGKYFLKVPGNSYRAAGNKRAVGNKESSNFACQMTGRLVEGGTGGWGMYIFAEGPRHGVAVTINSDSRLMIKPDPVDPAKEPRIGPIRHSAIKDARELNTLLVIVKGRRMAVYVNSVAVCEPFLVDRDITPCFASMGAFSDGEQTTHAEITRYTVWSSENLPLVPVPGKKE